MSKTVAKPTETESAAATPASAPRPPRTGVLVLVMGPGNAIMATGSDFEASKVDGIAPGELQAIRASRRAYIELLGSLMSPDLGRVIMARDDLFQAIVQALQQAGFRTVVQNIEVPSDAA